MTFASSDYKFLFSVSGGQTGAAAGSPFRVSEQNDKETSGEIIAHFDIIISFFTIIYGLMLTELFASLHRLIRARKRVRWNWLPLAAAWYILIVILDNWWTLAISENNAAWSNVYIFLLSGQLFVLFYLTVSAVLPDSVGEEGIDLKEYYFQNNRYLWGLLSAVLVVGLLINICRDIVNSNPVNYGNIGANMLIFAVTFTMAITKNKRFHSVSLIFLTAFWIFVIISKY